VCINGINSINGIKWVINAKKEKTYRACVVPISGYIFFYFYSTALLCCSALLLCSAARGSGSDDAGVDVQRSAVHYRTVAEIHSR
jgi:hypothetical protein